MTIRHPNFSIVPAGVRPFIHAVSTGFWLPEVADIYVPALTRLSQTMREQFGFARLLVDARAAAIHPPETIERLKVAGKCFGEVNDRIATVVATVLKKQQALRSAPAERGMTFTTIEAAEEWLSQEHVLLPC